MADIRLDLYIKDKLNISRQKAQELIQNESVSVNGKIVDKTSYKVCENDSVVVGNTDNVLKYVGRGGYKLEKAINEFEIEIKGVCVDIGASTGGFTDCMLQNGAELVYSVDVGNNQLVEKLLNDKRVISMENTDIRQAEIERADFISCDVSFISLSKILDSIVRILKNDGRAVVLIKPQFEAGRENISKNGIVKNNKIHKKVIRELIEKSNALGLYAKGLTFSPIKGGDGNIEYLMLLSRDKDNTVTQKNIEDVVGMAFNAL